MRMLCSPRGECASRLLSWGLCVSLPSTQDSADGEGKCSMEKPARHDLCQVATVNTSSDESCLYACSCYDVTKVALHL